MYIRLIMKKFILIAIVVIIVSALGFSGWYFLRREGTGRDLSVQNAGQNTESGPASAPSASLGATAGKAEIDKGTAELLKKFADDQDRDGIKDVDEKARGLNPNEFDSDFDGLSDKLEIEKYKTDPLKKDTDGDGFGDGKEVLKGYNPVGAGKLAE